MPSARQVNWAKFRASAVIVAGLLIFGALSFLLTGGTLLEPKTQIYLYLPDATGVAPGSPVRVDGIGVGKVTLVELSGSNEPNRVVKIYMQLFRSSTYTCRMPPAWRRVLPCAWMASASARSPWWNFPVPMSPIASSKSP